MMSGDMVEVMACARSAIISIEFNAQSPNTDVKTQRGREGSVDYVRSCRFGDVVVVG